MKNYLMKKPCKFINYGKINFVLTVDLFSLQNLSRISQFLVIPKFLSGIF